MSLQAMDSSHVALVSLLLQAEGFQSYRSDKPLTLGSVPEIMSRLGINMGNLAKVMKLAGNDDSITLKSEEDVSKLTAIFENASNAVLSLESAFRAGKEDRVRHEHAHSRQRGSRHT